MNNFIFGSIALCIGMTGLAIVLALLSIVRKLEYIGDQLLWTKETIKAGMKYVADTIGEKKAEVEDDFESLHKATDGQIIESLSNRIDKLSEENKMLWDKYNAEVRKNAPKEETHD